MNRIALTRCFTGRCLVAGLIFWSLSGCANSTGVTIATVAQSQNCAVDKNSPYWLAIPSRETLPAEFANIENNGPYWLAGLGIKPTGGYGLSISPEANIQNDQLAVNVTVEKPNGRVVTQAFTNPCVLLVSSDNNFTSVEWTNSQSGAVSNIATSPFRAAHFAREWP